jgi:hypothetical protein
MRTFAFDPLQSWGLEALVTIFAGKGPILFTSNGTPITLGLLTWAAAPGADITGIQFPADGSPANVDVTIMARPGGVIQPGDGLRGTLDGWDAQVAVIDPDNMQHGAFTLLIGTVGSVQEDANGLLTIAINGPLAQAKAPISEHYSIIARESLGDDRCKIPIMPADIGRNQYYTIAAPPPPGLQHVSDCFGRMRMPATGAVEDYQNVYFECTTSGITAASAPTYSPTGTTTDGTAQFTARNAWLRYVRGQATDPFTILFEYLPDSRASGDDTWYAPFCNLYVRSGPLTSTRIPVNFWNSAALTVQLAQPVSPTDFPAHTQFEIHRGCNLTANICNTIFNNIVNRRGEEFVPPDLISAYSTP